MDGGCRVYSLGFIYVYRFSPPLSGQRFGLGWGVQSWHWWPRPGYEQWRPWRCLAKARDQELERRAHGKQPLYSSRDELLREVGCEAWDETDDVGVDVEKVSKRQVSRIDVSKCEARLAELERDRDAARAAMQAGEVLLSHPQLGPVRVVFRSPD